MAKKIRYGVVGLGHIAQVAVLPAFKSASKNSVLTALVTDDPAKARQISRRYKVEDVYSYAQYDELLTSGLVDALYICLPNHMHLEYTVRALEAGLHVLCEKPLATSAKDCVTMHQAAKKSGKKLMTAYRLHFEEANLDALKLVKSGKLGELRYFASEFSYQITDKHNIRLKNETAGGPIWDIGIYCINAARSLMTAEPTEVYATAAYRPRDPRFDEVPETVSVLMKFPKERFATFTCSFGSDTASAYRLIGTKGALTVENAYEYASARKVMFLKDGKIKKTTNYRKADQFAPEIMYFSDCALKGRSPEPSALEGMNDVRIIEAINESIRTNKPVRIVGTSAHRGPTVGMKKRVPGHEEPDLVNAVGASS